jgi:hypothetical protein
MNARPQKNMEEGIGSKAVPALNPDRGYLVVNSQGRDGHTHQLNFFYQNVFIPLPGSGFLQLYRLH